MSLAALMFHLVPELGASAPFSSSWGNGAKPSARRRWSACSLPGTRSLGEAGERHAPGFPSFSCLSPEAPGEGLGCPLEVTLGLGTPCEILLGVLIRVNSGSPRGCNILPSLVFTPTPHCAK